MDLWQLKNTREQAVLQRLYVLYYDAMIHLQLNPKAIEERKPAEFERFVTLIETGSAAANEAEALGISSELISIIEQHADFDALLTLNRQGKLCYREAFAIIYPKRATNFSFLMGLGQVPPPPYEQLANYGRFIMSNEKVLVHCYWEETLSRWDVRCLISALDHDFPVQPIRMAPSNHKLSGVQVFGRRLSRSLRLPGFFDYSPPEGFNTIPGQIINF